MAFRSRAGFIRQQRIFLSRKLFNINGGGNSGSFTGNSCVSSQLLNRRGKYFRKRLPMRLL